MRSTLAFTLPLLLLAAACSPRGEERAPEVGDDTIAVAAPASPAPPPGGLEQSPAPRAPEIPSPPDAQVADLGWPAYDAFFKSLYATVRRVVDDPRASLDQGANELLDRARTLAADNAGERAEKTKDQRRILAEQVERWKQEIARSETPPDVRVELLNPIVHVTRDVMQAQGKPLDQHFMLLDWMQSALQLTGDRLRQETMPR